MGENDLTVPGILPKTEQGQTSKQQRLDRRANVILGVSGSVAAIKLEELAEKLSKLVNLKIVATSAAKHFLYYNAKWGSQVIDDESEWRQWKQKGDPVQHIQLSQWADILIIAPLSANTLAKIAHGFCDNLLTCIVRAWDISANKPIIAAPAMNTLMWTNPMTERHMTELSSIYRAVIISPITKQLACGDTGVGAMAQPDDIVHAVQQMMHDAS